MTEVTFVLIGLRDYEHSDVIGVYRFEDAAIIEKARLESESKKESKALEAYFHHSYEYRMKNPFKHSDEKFYDEYEIERHEIK